ncbi:ATP-dependent DNA helicase PcrA, partial [Enterococcus faecium]
IDQELLEIEGMRPTPKKTPVLAKKTEYSYKQPETAVVPSKSASGGENNCWNPGDKVTHNNWGLGTVVRVSGTSKDLD